MNEINSFTFYRNYYELIKYLPNKDRLQMYDTLFNYMFDGKEAKLDGLCNGIWVNLKMPLDTSRTNTINGKKGGRPKKQNETEEKPKENPNETETKTEVKTNTKANNISIFLFLISNFKFNNNINNLLKEYLELRIKKKYTLTESIVTRLCNKLIEYSTNDKEKEEIILNAINGAWKDFYPLKQQSKENKDEREKWLNEEE